MKIAILGFDIEGRASYDYFALSGHEITICDQNPTIDIPNEASSVLGESYLDDLDRFDLLVRTAGLHPQKILDKNPFVKAKITSQINEFLRVVPTKNVIGITGTKGKGTTSTLITKMLEADGKSVHLGGNIGLPPLTFLDDLNKDSWVVLELSSFQLIDLNLAPHIAVCLMVVPEHLNWHSNLDEYINAKAQLFIHQAEEDVAIYFAENETSKRITSSSIGHKIPYYAEPGAKVSDGSIKIENKVICTTEDLKLLGQHNWQNACAAVTVLWQINQNIGAIRSVLTSFSGLEHRLEFVRELNGINYYNDSFGTTPETAIAAIKSFHESEVVIVGGRGKGVSFSELAEVVKDSRNIYKVLVIGEAKTEIIAAFQDVGFSDYIETESKTMNEIVAEATELASSIDQTSIVLLSTACASFDMFKNYKQRGELFKQAVRAIA